MNRSQRRKNKISNTDPTYNLKASEIEKIKKEASEEAIEKAFICMLGFPLIVLRDKHGFGTKRLERFINDVTFQYNQFNEGYITLGDLIDVLKEETGTNLIDDVGRSIKGE